MPTYVEPLFRPPSEANSLIFQITIGCSQNSCTFCGMYKMKRFRVKPVDEVLAEIDSIPVRYRTQVDRVFLADGDAIVYPQDGLSAILAHLAATFPNLQRVGAYASPNSIGTKSAEELALLKAARLRILYFGLESGDDRTLAAVRKGYTAEEMQEGALKVRAAGIKLSVTAILGLAGRVRSMEHARATAAWINRVSPEYFSLLTLFQRHNDAFLGGLERCTRGELLREAQELVKHLAPTRTILRSNHVSNFLVLAGSYPKDRERIIADVESAIARGCLIPGYLDEVPVYGEEYY